MSPGSSNFGRRTRGVGPSLDSRAGARPAMMNALVDAVTGAVVLIGAPATVLDWRSGLVLPVEAARRSAEPARAEHAGHDDGPARVAGGRSVLDEVEQVLSGSRTRRDLDRILVTVLFTDIVGSTKRASELGDRLWRELLEAHDVSVRRQVAAHGGRVLKSLGDGYLATFDAPARAIHCGGSLTEDAESLGIEIKVGIHTGECELIGRDVAGMAVHIGARVLAKALPGEVLATSAVRDLVVGSGIEFAARGAHELEGVPGVWTLLAVEPEATIPEVAA